MDLIHLIGYGPVLREAKARTWRQRFLEECFLLAHSIQARGVGSPSIYMLLLLVNKEVGFGQWLNKT